MDGWLDEWYVNRKHFSWMIGWLDEWYVNRKHFSWMIGWMDVNRKHNFPWMRIWMRNIFFLDDKMDDDVWAGKQNFIGIPVP
jgi:hypothetical protein